MLGQVLTRVSVSGQPSGLHTAGHLLRLTTILSTHCFSSTSGFHETFMNVMAATKSADVNPKANHTATVSIQQSPLHEHSQIWQLLCNLELNRDLYVIPQ